MKNAALCDANLRLEQTKITRRSNLLAGTLAVVLLSCLNAHAIIPSIPSSHDSLNRITNVNRTVARQTWRYDPAGNRTDYSATIDFSIANIPAQQMDADATLSLSLVPTGSLPTTSALWIARSSNPLLVPKSGLQIMGEGTVSPTLKIIPVAGASGTVTITVIVRHRSVLTAATATSFLLTVGGNHAPVARDDSGNHPPGQAKLVEKAWLLHNDSDPDHDPFSMIALSATSAHGGNVQSHGLFVAYSPPPGYDGPDFYTYTIADSHGATATATVNLVVVPVTQAIQINSSPKVTLPNGNLLVSFSGRPGVFYDIQASTDLVNWTRVSTTKADATGRYVYEEPDTDVFPVRYYRAVYH